MTYMDYSGEPMRVGQLRDDPAFDDAELLPCPFCGTAAMRHTVGDEEPDNAGGDVICCSGCGASSHVEFGRKENLVSRWNTRTPASPQMDYSGEAMQPGQRRDPPTTADADTYEIGQVIFNHVHAFVNAAGILGTNCKLIITVPTEADRLKLTYRLRDDMGDRGPPRSAGRHGNSAGIWQGIEYEFASRTPASPTSDDVDRVARALHRHEWNGQPAPDNFSVDKHYWMDAAKIAITAMQPPQSEE